MLKCSVASLVMFAVILPSSLHATDEPHWKPESEEAALQILRKTRQSLGELRRFEIECLRSSADVNFERERRGSFRIYCEKSLGYLITCRPLDGSLMHSSRRTHSDEHYPVESDRSETWLVAAGQFTFLDEEQRTYETGAVTDTQSLFGSLFADMPRCCIPAWVDPSVDLDSLQTRFRIVSARSTSNSFLVEFAPLSQDPAWRIGDDERLRGEQSIVIDRHTLRPTRWWKKDVFGSELTWIYKRFDLNPPPRELRVSLDGYKNARDLPKPAPAKESKSGINSETLNFGAHILYWLLF